MEPKKKNVFASAASRIPIKLLDAVIIVGILAIAVLIPFLSSRGGFTVSFDSSGGSEVETRRLRYGDEIEEPEEPVRENYVFEGWYYDSEGKRKFDFDGAYAEESLTLYAVWSPLAEDVPASAE
ncbi:MAG: InlB B-repeat-containing protein [Clostridia bacterium]|nr:InlB B-repeat-containing protein [Clostridia bacterium]